MDKQTAYKAVQAILRTVGTTGLAAGAGAPVVLAVSGATVAVAELMGLRSLDGAMPRKLESCMEEAAKTVALEFGLDENKKIMLSDMGARLARKITNNEWDSLPGDALSCGFASASDFGEHFAPSELTPMLDAFRAHLYIAISKQPELSALLTLQSLENIETELTASEAIHTAHTEYLLQILDTLKILIQNMHQPPEGPPFVITNITEPPSDAKDADIPRSKFVGRDIEIEQLEKHIQQQDRVVVVNGIGGIGKTALCRHVYGEYIDKHKEGLPVPVDHVGYLVFKDSIDNTVYTGIKYTMSGNYEADVRAAWDTLFDLAHKKKIALFIDNVTDNHLGRLTELPCAVVLTSRRGDFRNDFQEIRLNTLPPEQCMEVFENAYGRKVTDTESLKHVVGIQAACHTLTVKLLAHIAKDKSWSVETLKNRLTEKKFQIVFNKTTIQNELEKLFDMAGLSGSEGNVLEAFSIFPYTELDAPTCHTWLDGDAVVEEDDEIYTGLYQKGWLERTEKGYKLHPVMAEMIDAKRRPEYENHTGLIKACGRSLYIGTVQVFTVALPYLPFAEAVAAKYEDEQTENMGRLIHQIGYIYQQSGDYPKALDWYEKALDIKEKVLGTEHPDTAASYNNIAAVCSRQGDYAKALEWYQKTLDICEKVLGTEHPYTATTYNNIAAVYDSQGDYAKALEWYQKDLAICEKVLGTEHPNTAASYNNIAGIYDSQGDYAKALEWYQKALAIDEKMSGPEHPDTATAYNNIAFVYTRQGDYAKALEGYQKALAICEKVLGTEHPDTASTYNNIARVYHAQGDYAGALDYYGKALRIIVMKFDWGHPYAKSVVGNALGCFVTEEGPDTSAFLEWFRPLLESLPPLPEDFWDSLGRK